MHLSVLLISILALCLISIGTEAYGSIQGTNQCDPSVNQSCPQSSQAESKTESETSQTPLILPDLRRQEKISMMIKLVKAEKLVILLTMMMLQHPHRLILMMMAPQRIMLTIILMMNKKVMIAQMMMGKILAMGLQWSHSPNEWINLPRNSFCFWFIFLSKSDKICLLS